MAIDVVSTRQLGILWVNIPVMLYKSFFLNGKLLKQINSTIIALISKVDNLEYAS